jgi:hypothetical protein
MRKIIFLYCLFIISLLLVACSKNSPENSFNVKSCKLDFVGNERTILEGIGYESPYAMYSCESTTVRLNLYLTVYNSTPAEFIRMNIIATKKYTPINVTIYQKVIGFQSEETLAHVWYDTNKIVYVMLVDTTESVSPDVEKLKIELLQKYPSAMIEDVSYFE